MNKFYIFNARKYPTLTIPELSHIKVPYTVSYYIVFYYLLYSKEDDLLCEILKKILGESSSRICWKTELLKWKIFHIRSHLPMTPYSFFVKHRFFTHNKEYIPTRISQFFLESMCWKASGFKSVPTKSGFRIKSMRKWTSYYNWWEKNIEFNLMNNDDLTFRISGNNFHTHTHTHIF